MNWLLRWFRSFPQDYKSQTEEPDLDSLDGRAFLRLLRSENTLPLCALSSQARRKQNDRRLINLLRQVSLSEAERLIQLGGGCRLAVLSDHPDGHVRERVVRELVLQGPEALATLLVRANDWFEPIAQMASSRAIEVLPLTPPGSSLGYVAELVFRLSSQTRRDHSALVRAYVEEVARHRGAAEFARQITRGRCRRWAFHTLREVGESEPDAIRKAIWLGDVGTVLWACGQAAELPETHEFLHCHPYVTVRRRALAFGTEEVLQKALIDPDAGVRSDARYRLGTRHDHSIYLALLPKPGAISGLGETGTRSDAKLLHPFLDAPQADLRCRAVEAIFRLIGDEAEEILWMALRDPSRKVQRAAATALAGSKLAIDPEQFVSLDLNPRIRGLLLNRSPRWSALIAVLKKFESLEGSERWILGWTSRSSRIAPRPEEAIEITQLVRPIEPRLSKDVAAALRASIAFWLKH